MGKGRDKEEKGNVGICVCVCALIHSSPANTKNKQMQIIPHRKTKPPRCCRNEQSQVHNCLHDKANLNVYIETDVCNYLHNFLRTNPSCKFKENIQT